MAVGSGVRVAVGGMGVSDRSFFVATTSCIEGVNVWVKVWVWVIVCVTGSTDTMPPSTIESSRLPTTITRESITASALTRSWRPPLLTAHSTLHLQSGKER